VPVALTALLLRWESPAGAVVAALTVTALFVIPGLSLARALLGCPTPVPGILAIGLTAGIAAVPLALHSISLIGIPIEWWTLAAVAVALTAAGIALTRARAIATDSAVPDVVGKIELPMARGQRIATVVAIALVMALLAGRLEAIVATAVFVAYSAAVVAVLARPGVRTGAQPDASVLAVRSWVLGLGAAGLLAAGAGSRLLLFAYDRAPLGFDSGIYRGLQDAWAAALPGIPSFAAGSHESQQEPGLFLLTDALHLSGWSTDATLWGLLIGLQVLMALGLWLPARDLGGPPAGLWALLLFAVSATQLTAFWHVYYKQVLAPTLLLYLLWLWRRQSWLVVPIGALLAGTHNMTLLLVAARYARYH
jgi:hypothetical protein